jgi:hypothetical protein
MAQPGKDDALNMLKAWFERDLSRYARWDRDVELVEHLADGTIRVRIYTDVHCFAISARPTGYLPQAHPRDLCGGKQVNSYLGCIASARKPRAGEDHGRGNDLCDGPLNEETWIGILGDIVSYEMVQLQRQKLPSGVGRRGEQIRHSQADETPPMYGGTGSGEQATIIVSEDGKSATVWPAGMGPQQNESLEPDGAFRERISAVADPADRPAIMVASSELLGLIGAKYGKHRYGCAPTPNYSRGDEPKQQAGG